MVASQRDIDSYSQAQPAGSPSPEDGAAALDGGAASRRIVVVGGGAAGVRCAERLSRAPNGPPVVVLSDERWRPYDRVRLSALVARELDLAMLDEMPRLERCARLAVLSNRRVVRIDRERKVVVDQRGNELAYDKLVLATGSRARIPPIPGVELKGVFVFRSLADAEGLLARQIASRSTVVIGGGLLGLEAARGMLRFGTRVTVVEHEPRLMFNQLDDEAARRLALGIERLGIGVRVASSVQQIIGMQTPVAVRLKSGEEIDCDTVVIATGITPNVELARDAGIAVGRGIRVDDRMRTSDADIYAVGECSEHRGKLYGLVGPALEQAAVAAENLLGNDSTYRGSVVASSLKVAGCPVFSMGEIDPRSAHYTGHVFADAARYRRLNVHAGRIVGAVGFGDWNTARLRVVALEGHRVWPWQLARFRRTGEITAAASAEQVAAWPATAVVCNCRGVPRGTLSEAAAGGAESVEALGYRTGAGTVCGSCKPLLANLLGAAAARVPVRRALLAFSAAAALVALLGLFLAVPYQESAATDWKWDVIWRAPALKQASGFTLLGLALVASLLSLRKRIARFAFGRFTSWQVAHVVLGVVGCAALGAHTGFRFGANLNLWLMTCFTSLLLAGGIGGTALALGSRLAPRTAQALRKSALWLHVVLLWPLPVLLGFHVLKSYYF